MTNSQEKQLINAFSKIAQGGGRVTVEGAIAKDAESLIASCSSLDTNNIDRLIQDLYTVIAIMESSDTGLQQKPKYKPHANIKIDSDGWYDGMGTTWH